MADAYVALSKEDRLDALRVAATNSGRPAHLLEKDIWVVLAIEALFNSPEGENLVFKGGTSLSKGYGVIERFSEDIDLTYDVRKMIPELAEGDPPIPRSNAQAQKWRDLIDKRLPKWVKNKALPILEAHFRKVGVEAKLVADGHKLFVHYDPLTEPAAYNPPRVMLEFGARATGDPAEPTEVTCDAAEHLDLEFPRATPSAMLPERTFWEKATAVHVFCHNLPDDDRISRHWHDLVKLDDAGYAETALKDRKLAGEVADHKSRFHREKDRNGNQIDYHAAVDGKLVLVPDADKGDRVAVDDLAMRACDGNVGPDLSGVFGAGFVSDPVLRDALRKRAMRFGEHDPMAFHGAARIKKVCVWIECRETRAIVTPSVRNPREAHALSFPMQSRKNEVA